MDPFTVVLAAAVLVIAIAWIAFVKRLAQQRATSLSSSLDQLNASLEGEQQALSQLEHSLGEWRSTIEDALKRVGKAPDGAAPSTAPAEEAPRSTTPSRHGDAAFVLEGHAYQAPDVEIMQPETHQFDVDVYADIEALSADAIFVDTDDVHQSNLVRFAVHGSKSAPYVVTLGDAGWDVPAKRRLLRYVGVRKLEDPFAERMLFRPGKAQRMLGDASLVLK